MTKLVIAAKSLLIAACLGTLLTGCTQTYLANSDRVAHSSGNAVKANLARETINPSDKLMNKTTGLGKNGNVQPTP